MRILRQSIPVLVAVCLSLAAHAQRLHGTVTDPDDRRIVGANVLLDCRGNKQKVMTDANGEFHASAPCSYSGCSVNVSKSGFAIFHQRLGEKTEDVQIRLKMAQVRQQVQVRAMRTPPHEFGASNSAYLDATELARISNDTSELVTYAKNVAGIMSENETIYVDGLPSTSLPPAGMIQAISVNGDPFSVEYSDGDHVPIEITTGKPDRSWHYSWDGATMGMGGNSDLGRGLHSSSRLESPNLSGPLPYTPITFTVQGGVGSNSSSQFIESVTTPAVTEIRRPRTRTDSASTSVGLYYAGPKNLHAGSSYLRRSNHTWNSGVGGLTLTEAGMNDLFRTQESRTFLEQNSPRRTLRTGLVLSSADMRSLANDTSMSIDVLGYFLAGGATETKQSTTKEDWTWKSVLQSNSERHSWTSGITFSHRKDFQYRVPNPLGQLRFPSIQDYKSALAGSPTGTWIGERGAASASYGSDTISPFFQGEILRTQQLVIRAGLRSDYQSRAGFSASPRVSAISQFHGFIFRGGSGMFVQSWPNLVMLLPLLQDGIHARQFVASGVSMVSIGGEDLSSKEPIIARVAPGIVRPRIVSSTTSLEHLLGGVDLGIEFNWASGKHLLGWRRVPTSNGWTDWLESDRDQHRAELRGRLRYGWKGQSVIANYEWIHSRDNSDGPFSYAEHFDNLRGEWARTSGVPAHNFSLIGNLSLPHSFSVTLLGSAHGPTPYNILSGKDVNNNGLFNDRDGMMRNSGNGPSYNMVSLYGSRHISFGRIFGRREKTPVADIGLQVDNLLGRRNYLALDPVRSSPLFGRPLTGLPTRSLRLWLKLAQ